LLCLAHLEYTETSRMSDSQLDISPVASTGTTYYVDALAGDDTADGSVAASWRSLKRVNQQVFAAGDSILFKAGRRWQGQYYVQYYRLKGAR
jgi:hypothetical protein